MAFARYIDDNKNNIRAIRSQHYQGNTLEKVVEMSLPFEYKPSTNTKKGVLLTHGFLTSPYIMRSLAENFAQQNFLVRAILLPGHGTEYQDLDHYTWQDWLNALRFGYQCLENDCEEIYLCGFSIGATLSLLLALELKQLQKTTLKKIILLTPCLGINPLTKSFPFLVKHHVDKLLPNLRCTQAEKEHLGSYTQFSIKSISQIAETLKALKKALTPYATDTLSIPTYIAASTEDATVKFTPIIDFARRYLQKDSYLYVYSNTSPDLPTNIHSHIVQTQHLQKNINAISHVAIPVAPTDPYFGAGGSYYGAQSNNTIFGEPHYNQKIKRLTYNPDYEKLQQSIFHWLL